MSVDEQDLKALTDDAFLRTPAGSAVMLRVKDDPSTALKLIGGGTSLTLAQGARALDNIIGSIGDDETAKVLVAQHVTPEAQAEFLAGWGDRVSALSVIAQADTLMFAIHSIYCGDADGENDLAMAAAVIHSLALRIHDRSDWAEILDHEFAGGGYTFSDILIAAVAAEVEPTGEDGSLPPDAWVNVGLDPDEAQERLLDLPVDLLNEVTSIGVLKARVQLAASRVAHGLPSAVRGSAEDV
ncbi:MAG: hypothetical protein WC654_06950 [Patescibacteria group bacterium]